MSARTRLLIAGLVLAGIGLFAVAALAGDDDPDDVSVTRTDGLIAISPTRGSEVLKQARVSVTLEARWELRSMVLYDNPALAGGIDVTSFVNLIGGNQYVYAPAEGLPWEEHSADDNCVVVRFEDISTGVENEIDWCFTAS